MGHPEHEHCSCILSKIHFKSIFPNPDLCLPQERPRQAHELSLTDAQVVAALRHLVLQAVGQVAHVRLEVGLLERLPNVAIAVRMVQLNLTPEIEVFYMLFDRSLSIFTMTSLDHQFSV